MPGWELIGKEERDAVNHVFDHGGVLYRYGWADKRENIYRVDDFERAFAKKMGISYSLALCSGTAALIAGLKALGVKKGDEVITQSHTFIATVEAIVESGAVPVIADVDRTLNMDPVDLKRKITPKTRAVIPVHMMGVASRMKEIQEIARAHNVPVLEDNAQSCGGEYRGKKLGTIGDAGITSFDFGKVLTTGEGGMILTDNETIFRRAREYSDHGHELNPNFPRGEDTRSMSGVNFKMTELQGAIGLAQLKKMDYIISCQRKNKLAIKDGLSGIGQITFRDVPNPEGDTGDSVIFFFEDREQTKKFMKLWIKKGFGTKNLPDAINWHYAGTWDHILHNYKRYAGKDLSKTFRQSDDLLRSAVALPVFVKMPEQQIETIVAAVQECVETM
ncbi:MAG: DegT/DnrJ/EryC1/StrS family aminotransferase [Methanoregulaceae archaeon]|jgi:8-amino-3,8-dideoxy-alpha-D-manno-octulosonate transaminase|nr:DegT/DnrJ/EryC1/StrS family aminotransferase [Methanoregulaceae archaeon]